MLILTRLSIESGNRQDAARRVNSFERTEEVSESFGTESFIEASEFFADQQPAETAVATRVDASTMTDTAAAVADPAIQTTPLKGFSTPAPVLRERLTSLAKDLQVLNEENAHLRDEMHELCSFTRLEEKIGVHNYTGRKASSSEVRFNQSDCNPFDCVIDSKNRLFACL